MTMPCPPVAIVRLCAVATLAVLLSTVLPAPVGFAQSAPPLTPWRGYIDHASVTVNSSVPTMTVELAGRAISGDGRYLVMQSRAEDLVADDFNFAQDIFLRDRQTGTTTRLSVGIAGAESDGFSDAATISTNGRHVAFASSATNLVPGDTNSNSDIFVRDLDGARTVRVSIGTDGAQADGPAYSPAISATGRFVAFVASVSTLVPGPAPYGPMQVYLHDRDADGNGTFDEPGTTVTTIESLSGSGAIADAMAFHVRVSADGRFVLFESTATNLDPVGNPSSSNHVYLRDRQAGTTALIDRAITGGPSMWGTDYRTADMSDDGRFITYATYSTDIVLGYENWQSQVLRYDRQATENQTAIVTVLPDGTVGDAYSYDSSISADGRYVAFRSTSTNLATPAQAPNNAGVFVRDMLTGTFTRIDVLDTGEGFDHSFPYAPSISADGSAVAFASDARNAVDGIYTFGSYHAFVATAFNIGATSASFPMAGGLGSIDVDTLPVTGWQAVSLDPWIALLEGGGFAAGPRTVHYSVEPNSDGIVRHGRIKLGSKIVAIHQEGDGDATPPVITPTVTGTLSPSGWYTSDITVQWSVSDPDSEIINTGYGCVTSTFTSDFMYANPTCEATSHGGTTSVSVPLRRDTTPPVIAITSPLSVYYPTGTNIVPSFACTDSSSYSGTASCERAGSGPLDSTTPGWRPFTVTSTDYAGNASTKTVEYLIGTGACVVRQPDLKAWWRFDGSMVDAVAQLHASPSAAAGWFDTAVAGQGWNNGGSNNYLVAANGSDLVMSSAMTVAMWIKPIGIYGFQGTLATKPAQYRIARFPDGTLRWAFSHTSGYNWVNTGVIIPYQQWSHVAVTYDNGSVNSYVNGRLVHSHQLAGSLVSTGDPNVPLTIAGRADVLATLNGSFDDVQIYHRAIAAADVAALAQAGSGSLCLPSTSTLTVTAPSTIGYGATFRVTAVLRDEAGSPIANRQVWLNSHIAPGGFAGGVSGTTDAAGEAFADLPVSASAALGPYARAASAVFEGDITYAAASAEVAATLVAGTPAVSWPSPTSVTYGTALSAAQLNATATVPGSFSYSPSAGTTLGAGTHALNVTFTPDDAAHWGTATSATTLTVDKAAPVVTVTGGTFTYDGQPHPGTGRATGVLGEELTPVQLLYGEGSSAPVNVGTYSVRASFAGSDNYTAGESAAAPLTIEKAVAQVQWTPGAAGIVYGTPLSGAQLNASATVPGTFTYSPGAGAVLAVGSHLISATFAPADSANYTGASTTRTVTVQPAPLSIVANNAAKPFGAPLPTFSVTPSGFVNGESLASLSGTLSFTTPATASSPVAAYPIVPQGLSSANYAISFVAGTLAVVKADTAVAFSASPNPSGLNQPVTFTASVAVLAPGAGAPSGIVQFVDGSTLLGSAVLVGGSASITTNGLAAGSHSIAAMYFGDASFAGSSAASVLTVRSSSTSSTTTLTSTRNPANVGQSVTFRATVSAPSGGVSGAVEFYDGTVLIGSASISNGVAQLATSSLPAGGHAIVARYLGNASLPPSLSAPLAQTVGSQSRSSSIALSIAPSPSTLGSDVTMTATVTGSHQKAPTGKVLFMVNGQVLDEVQTTVTGSVTAAAALNVSALPRGTHSIAVVYLADATFRASSRTATLMVD